jgi:hypothetical protein
MAGDHAPKGAVHRGAAGHLSAAPGEHEKGGHVLGPHGERRALRSSGGAQLGDPVGQGTVVEGEALGVEVLLQSDPGLDGEEVDLAGIAPGVAPR